MARITFSPNQPIQSLSGTICGVTYSTRANGQTFATIRRHSKHPVIDECVFEIQREQIRKRPHDLQRIANERRALYDRIRRLYNKFIDDPELRLSDNKLRTAILEAFGEKR